MAKLILISIILATVIIPLRATRDRSPVRGLKKALLWALLFNVAYALALMFVYPHVI